LSDAAERKKFCKKEFEAADADGSGSLDVEEVKDVIFSICNGLHIRLPKEEKVMELVSRCDKSHDGALQFGEFATAFKAVLQSCVHEAELEAEASKENAAPEQPNEVLTSKVAEQPEVISNVEENLTSNVPEATSVTDAMVMEKMKLGLEESLQQRVNTRAYFLWQNGCSGKSEDHYFQALKTEMEVLEKA